MGITNYGSQEQFFSYGEAATSTNFNQLNTGIIPVGIYSGLSLLYINNTTVAVQPGTIVITDPLSGVTQKIVFTSSQNITVSSTTPYIIIRRRFEPNSSDYADMFAVNYPGMFPSTIIPTTNVPSLPTIMQSDIILGRCIYNEGTGLLQTNFDYSLKTTASLETLDLNKIAFSVIPTDPISNQVLVNGGSAIINGVNLGTLGQLTSPAFTSTSTLPRWDVLYINSSGQLAIDYGTPSASPSSPYYPQTGMVVAEIHRVASRTDINGTEIIQVNPNRNNPNISSNDVTPENTDYNNLTQNGNYRNVSNLHSPDGSYGPFLLELKNYLLGQEIYQTAQKIGINYPKIINNFFRTTAQGSPTIIGATPSNGGNLAPGTTYYYVVAYKTNSGVSTPSAEKNATPAGGNLTVNVTWTPNTNSAIIGYRVYRGTSSGSYNNYIDVIGSATGLLTDTNNNAWIPGSVVPNTTDQTPDTQYVIRNGDEISLTVTPFSISPITVTYTNSGADTVYSPSAFVTLLNSQMSSLLTYVSFNVDIGFTNMINIQSLASQNIQELEFKMYSYSSLVTPLIDQTSIYTENTFNSRYYRTYGEDGSWSSWKCNYSDNFEFLNQFFNGTRNMSDVYTYNSNGTLATETVSTTVDNYTQMVSTFSYNSNGTLNTILQAFYLANVLVESYLQTFVYNANLSLANITCAKQ